MSEKENSFLTMIEKYREGSLAAELDHDLKELVSEVERMGKGGRMEVVIALGAPNPNTGAMSIVVEYRSKPPKFPRDPQQYFVNPKTGALQLEHPKQVDMFAANVTPIKQQQGGE